MLAGWSVVPSGQSRPLRISFPMEMIDMSMLLVAKVLHTSVV